MIENGYRLIRNQAQKVLLFQIVEGRVFELTPSLEDQKLASGYYDLDMNPVEIESSDG